MKNLPQCDKTLNERKLSLFPLVTVLRKTVLLLLLFLALREVCAGNSLLKTERRSTWLREVQEHENASLEIEIGCSEEVWSCVTTPLYLLKYGDPSKGEDVIRNGFFMDVCRSLKEFEQCAKDSNDIRDPKCADVVSRVSKTIPIVCDNPVLPKKLQTCINSHYDEMMSDFPSRQDAIITEQATDRDMFCSQYRQLVDDTVALFKTCPNTRTLWTAENEATFRKNFYPVVFPRPMPFQCNGR